MKRLSLVSMALIVLGAIAAPVWGEASAPSRIVSINLCADELLLALADLEQIVALSPYAADPEISFLAKEAEKFRHDAGEAETVVGLEPDLVFAGRYTKLATRNMLARLGYTVVLLDAARSIDQSIAQIGEVAALVGHPERGERLIDEIETARERALVAAAGRASTPSAAAYQRRGYVTGVESLIGELLTTVGLSHEGGDLVGGRGGFVPLERLVDIRPDYLVVSAPDKYAEDQGTALLAHPALNTLYPPERRIIMPDVLTACAGPSLPAAVDWLTAEVVRITAAP
jgi:iron complex transport system substrate-binding protein